MRAIFKVHVQILNNMCPIDAMFRRKIMGEAFWAQAQEYRFTPIGAYSGVLLDYKIKRGGMGRQKSENTNSVPI